MLSFLSKNFKQVIENKIKNEHQQVLFRLKCIISTFIFDNEIIIDLYKYYNHISKLEEIKHHQSNK